MLFHLLLLAMFLAKSLHTINLYLYSIIALTTQLSKRLFSFNFFRSVAISR